ncbi:MAG: DUF5320 domain-containing protein [Bacillota bacterium]
MPRGDGTGPEGLGPQTGRAAGYCAGFDVPGYANGRPRQGLARGRRRGAASGRGLGRGRGMRARNRVFATQRQANVRPQTAQDEAAYLKQEKKALQDELEAIENRLETLADENQE